MNRIHSIYYHNPNPEQFERVLSRYASRGYRFISLGELYSILSEKKVISEKLCFISFDDGWQSNLSLLPIIERFQAPICIFVATEPIESGNYWWEFITKERGLEGMNKFKSLPFDAFNKELAEAKKQIDLVRSSMTIDELKRIAKHPLVSIQSHTVDHPILTNVPLSVLEKELSESKHVLEELSGKEVFAFSYPNGSFTRREVTEVERFYRMAFTTEQRHITLKDNLCLLPRIALTGDYSRDVLKIYGIWPVLKKIAGWFK